ncbi:hypothetical protein ACFCV3_02190 [Kribbella sp. NPDC056345]|uniref:hypothetical protein n=1 Tax=Kribbella sp. NPDC056345 TaxID=3345789 RepID=UPI0035D72F65
MPQDDSIIPPADMLRRLTEVLRTRASAAPAEAVSADDPLEALYQLRHLRDRLNAWEPQLIDAARSTGTSWAQLAPALGVATRQAAERRYLRLHPNAAQPGLNREQRVQATRDQRAGERAVAEWARHNAADLRRVAGQVAALSGLDSRTQASIDAVHDALGNNDTTALLAPLSQAGPQLSGEHPDLADRISDLGARSDEARQSGRERKRT